MSNNNTSSFNVAMVAIIGIAAIVIILWLFIDVYQNKQQEPVPQEIDYNINIKPPDKSFPKTRPEDDSGPVPTSPPGN